MSSAEITSGAIQYGLPTTVLRLFMVFDTVAETPKSAVQSSANKHTRTCQ